MKAAQIAEYGDATKVEITETESPAIKPEQVLVRVKASSLNPFDTVIREGYMQDMIPLELPVTLGGDIAGEIIEIGDAVSNFQVGDAVYGQANVVAGNTGAFAEFAATSAAQIAKQPSTLTALEAASLPLVGISALQALTEHIDLKKGQKILITGGAGGIGQVAIQLAKHLGAHVATTVAKKDMDTVASLGADEIFDYATQDYTEKLSDFDAAFDTVGGENIKKIASILKEDGIAVSMAGQPEASGKIQTIAQMTHVSTERLDTLRELVESGIVNTNIGKIFTLDEIQEAFKTRETGSVSGKIVLNIHE